MLTNTSNPNEHWGSIDKLIRHWLKERQELIVLYCKVDGLKEFTSQDVPITVRVQALCQVLIDYVSAGHFEIYQKLLDEAGASRDYRALIARFLSEIEKSTALALEFNDRYATPADCEKALDTLARDLNFLGVAMVERFELEDQLIEALNEHHARRHEKVA